LGSPDATVAQALKSEPKFLKPVSRTPAGAKAKGFYDLVRPELPAAAGICVVAGELLGLGRLPSAGELVLGFLAGFFVSGSEMVFNDYFDVDVDRVNRPERPLPSNRVTPNEAMAFASVLSAAGFVASALLSAASLALIAAVWVVGFLYNWRFKEAGLLGNLMVSFSVAMTFVFGGVGVAGLANGVVLVFGASAFVFDLSEEISSGIMDAAGDEKRSVRSLARVKGRAFAMRVSGLLLVLFVALTLVPYLAGWLGLAYIAMVTVVDLAVAVIGLSLVRSDTTEEGRMRIRQLYITLTLFVVALIVSKFLFL